MKPNIMRNLLNLLLLTLGLSLLGCATSHGPGYFLASTAQTVKVGMDSFFIAAELGRVSLEQSNRVVEAYRKYQRIEAISTNAFALSVTSTNKDSWLLASNALFLSQSALLSLLNTQPKATP